MPGGFITVVDSHHDHYYVVVLLVDPAPATRREEDKHLDKGRPSLTRTTGRDEEEQQHSKENSIAVND
jgi:hypothetical protein